MSLNRVFSCFNIILIVSHCTCSEYSKTMLEEGKTQYQLLQERGKLPIYGTCWTQAIKQIEGGCQELSEQTQSEMALQLTNCFLEMSGHETYPCNNDKKPNLRKICMSNLNDRAFNVYTEFYTHTQKICWFLHGQVWQQTIARSSEQIGRYLEKSMENQQLLLDNQQSTLKMQERLMGYSGKLEDVLKNFLDITTRHQNVFQAWILGEVTWIDSIIYYLTCSAFIFVSTSMKRTENARFPLIALLAINIIVERFLSYTLSRKINLEYTIHDVHTAYYTYVWYFRYLFMIFTAFVLFLSGYFYVDYNVRNNNLLEELSAKVDSILSKMTLKNIDEISNISEISNVKNMDNLTVNDFKENSFYDKLNNKVQNKTPSKQLLANKIKYNLRSRNGTPDI